MRCPHCQRVIIDEEWIAENPGAIQWFANTFYSPITDLTARHLWALLGKTNSTHLAEFFAKIKDIPESALYISLGMIEKRAQTDSRLRHKSIGYYATCIRSSYAELAGIKKTLLPLPKGISNEVQSDNSKEPKGEVSEGARGGSEEYPSPDSHIELATGERSSERSPAVFSPTEGT